MTLEQLAQGTGAAVKVELDKLRAQAAKIEADIARLRGPAGIRAEDLVFELSDREVLVKGIVGDQERELARLVLPVVFDAGDYEAGRGYDQGDLVTADNSLWIAQEATSTRPGSPAGATAWRLALKGPTSSLS